MTRLKSPQDVNTMSEWQPIETAPSGWLQVSMRDVDREPPMWVARREIVEIREKRKPLHRPRQRALWVARDDKMVCSPTHWREGRI